MDRNKVYIGSKEISPNSSKVVGELVRFEGEDFYRITNYDAMRPFFMSIVSDSNHWLFISSTGGLSAGRKNSEFALFPYYTDDKITESFEHTGSKTILLVHEGEKAILWEPFSQKYQGVYNTSRNLYKSSLGNKIVFEEINHDLELTFRYQWNSSNTFGFVRKSKLINNSGGTKRVSLLDGVQNIMPYGVPDGLQNGSSNLVDAYKKSELLEDVGLGIYALSAIIVDKAEPSEALRSNIVWSVGLEEAKHLLSSLQLDDFRQGKTIDQEIDIRAERGAYFLNDTIEVEAGSSKEWMLIANVNQSMLGVSEIRSLIQTDTEISSKINDDIELGSQNLIQLNSAADGLQLTADSLGNARHFSNSLFNIMRGGIFDDNYIIEKSDFNTYLKKANIEVYKGRIGDLNDLPETFSLQFLRKHLIESDETNQDPDFKRLCLEYLPLKFSRRHGDPSRPWNKFSINTRSEIDGSKILDYQGNWRDIFQNWEALAYSYPEFIEGMIHKFLNASTFEGYNPYRVTKDGFDWEIIEPDDPWSYIGYWGDHQIIYLLKFLEFIEKYYPKKLEAYFNDEVFVYANVPYKIKSYQDILKNPKDTIDFDIDLDVRIRAQRDDIGADGALLTSESGEIYRVNLIEKLMATLLAKLSNFIPEGGIWLNTQRPEWNDANNALVGNGVSMVTLYYIRRFLGFLKKTIEHSAWNESEVSIELHEFYEAIFKTLAKHKQTLKNSVSNRDRKVILDALGKPASKYRSIIYNRGFSGVKSNVTKEEFMVFIDLTLDYMDHSIKANKRNDYLYHAYNIMSATEDEITIDYLPEMLEGQVAALSSGKINGNEALTLLDALRNSALYREDQESYILYPDKELLRFEEKNRIPQNLIEESPLIKELLLNNNRQVVEKDIYGDVHFNSKFRNANDLKKALSSLHDAYDGFDSIERNYVLNIFEQVFNHKAFTGRSGTFYGYEGLGSIYWHMVSKLLLSVQEVCLQAIKKNESQEIVDRLIKHYQDINRGLGTHKSPDVHGAIPIDPYSHTPGGKGAQQPGMTGQVKEDILCRFGELGVEVENGQLVFNPRTLNEEEFLKRPKIFRYFDVNGEEQKLEIEKDSLVFTYCQVPVVYMKSDDVEVKVHLRNNEVVTYDSSKLSTAISQKIFRRNGEVEKIIVNV